MRTLVALLILGGCWTSPPARPSQPTAPVAKGPRTASYAMFGVFDETGQLRETRRIPLQLGTQFGWRIELPCTEPTPYSEALKLAGPGDWVTDAETTISEDQTTALVDAIADCHEGWIEKTWSVSAGDPPGPIEVTVKIPEFAPIRFRAVFVN